MSSKGKKIIYEHKIGCLRLIFLNTIEITSFKTIFYTTLYIIYFSKQFALQFW